VRRAWDQEQSEAVRLYGQGHGKFAARSPRTGMEWESRRKDCLKGSVILTEGVVSHGPAFCEWNVCIIPAMKSWPTNLTFATSRNEHLPDNRSLPGSLVMREFYLRNQVGSLCLKRGSAAIVLCELGTRPRSEHYLPSRSRFYRSLLSQAPDFG